MGYDGTDGSRAALDEALALAGEIGGRVHLVFAFSSTRFGGELRDLDEAIRARLLRETETGYAFGHALLREGVYWGLSGPRRMLPHARAGETLERLAGDFLSGSVRAEEAGLVLFVAAGLQVYFTRMAAGLPPTELRLLPERGLCPCCGSLPVGGLVTASGQTPGTRDLHCSLCSTAWNHVRAVCITCEGTRDLELQSIEGGSAAVVGETCPSCSTFREKIFPRWCTIIRTLIFMPCRK